MNVIVICLDTLRWDALGAYGSSWVRTPAIDHYARRATRFDAAYCGSFPAVPMRVDAYTGNVNWPRYGWKAPDPEQPKLPLLLREAGYTTGLVLDTVNNVQAGLHEYYDEYCLIEKDIDDGMTPEQVDFSVPREHMRANGTLYAGQMAARSHYRHERDWDVARTMCRACDWLEDHAAQRFFLWVDTFEIHENWGPPTHYIDLYSRGYDDLDYSFPNYGYTDIYQPQHLERLRARYAGEVTLADRWVGHLLRQIELMALFENTTVILVSDHGMYLGEHRRMGKHTVDETDPWPIYDEVGRLPVLVWTPLGNGPARVTALCQVADIMPTVLDLCGVAGPATVGKSWLPLLKGETTAGHEAVFTSCHSGTGPGTGKASHITVTEPRYSAVFGRRPHKPELYDRLEDPSQTQNMADDRPDLVQTLHAKLRSFMRAQGAGAEYLAEYVGEAGSTV